MDKAYFQIINSLRRHYEQGGNVIEYLKNYFGRTVNNFDDIMLSYDLQAGSYIRFAKEHPAYIESYAKETYSIISNLGKISSILEAGVGEATTFANVLKLFDSTVTKGYGIDLSWSRVKYAIDYLSLRGLANAFVSTGNIFALPFADKSIDVVYTSHSIEPNGGNEKPLLEELYRVTGRYLVLFEPAFDLAKADAKKRMLEHGYCVNLYSTIKELGYKVLEHRLLKNCSNPLNPTGLTIIEKSKAWEQPPDDAVLACPITGFALEEKETCFYSKDACLAYPVIQNIPCFLPENAILATHFND